MCQPLCLQPFRLLLPFSLHLFDVPQNIALQHRLHMLRSLLSLCQQLCLESLRLPLPLCLHLLDVMQNITLQHRLHMLRSLLPLCLPLCLELLRLTLPLYLQLLCLPLPFNFVSLNSLIQGASHCGLEQPSKSGQT